MNERTFLNAEQQVIAEIFIDENAAVYALGALEPEDFGNGFCKMIFEIVSKRFNSGTDFDAISVCADCPEPEQARVMLYDIAQLCISTENYKEHIKIVKEQSKNRLAYQLGNELSEMIYGSRKTIAELQAEAIRITDAFDDEGIKTAVSAAEGLENYLQNFGVKRAYLETGFDKLDDCLKISEGDYIVLGARPSVGKTAFALQVAWWMGMNHKVLFFSFETSAKKIYDRIIANQCTIKFSRIVRGSEIDSDKKLAEMMKDQFGRNKFKVVEASGMTVPEIQAMAVRERAEIVFIDYLGLIATPSDQVMSSYESVTKISKDLHTMAQKRKIAVFALSQLNREGNDKPSLTSLRDSGQIEQDADAVLMLSKATDYNDSENQSYRLLSVVKNKEGTLADYYLYFDGDGQKFSDDIDESKHNFKS